MASFIQYLYGDFYAAWRHLSIMEIYIQYGDFYLV